MTNAATPATYRTGKICYIEIPATDVQQSAEFYSRAFGWQIRKRGDGSTAFDDTVNQVSGTWVLGRPAATLPGLMVYIMVGSAPAAVEAIVSAGGEIVKPVDPGAREVVATFRDPAGNLIGIYQQPGLAETEVMGTSRPLPGQPSLPPSASRQSRAGSRPIQTRKAPPGTP